MNNKAEGISLCLCSLGVILIIVAITLLVMGNDESGKADILKDQAKIDAKAAADKKTLGGKVTMGFAIFACFFASAAFAVSKT
jgi:hypothetical protein